MKIGLFGINMGPLGDAQASIRIAQLAESAGFESLWAGEHVVLPEPQLPPSPVPPRYPMVDPNICFAALSGHTRTVRFGTGIIILPQRNPLVLAKEMASLDVVTGGRLIFGVGIGYLKAEFDALGIPFNDKAGRTREYLEAMRSIWCDEQPAYHGQYVDFAGVQAYPRPLQAGGPPVVFGGHVPGAFARSVTHGHGWYGFGLKPEDTAACIAGLEQAARDHARPQGLGKLEISVTPFGNIDLDRAKAYADLGVDRLIVLFPAQSPDTLFELGATEQAIADYVKKLGDEVVGRV
ncbi:MAG: TIGR03619 family F420-dependent LLM class oxidoreductase [Gammaproteobacteria bacterium]|nr:TIGR03619 family F420-dependent LLM class oxidoreductase [Gammaproteobacteria bacterium]MCP5199125.1 TIGR03619 family F420-dependent LLM class oxidoreductase [Gammaproteobacteria bacterium]